VCEVSNNSFFITDSGNNNSQIRISRIGVYVKNNRFHSENSLFDFCVKTNAIYDYLLEDNLKISSVGVSSLSTYVSLPTATMFYVGKKISTLIGNVTVDYMCRQKSAGVFEFYKVVHPDDGFISTAPVGGNKLLAQNGSGAAMVIGANNGTALLTTNTDKTAKFAMPNYTASNMTSNLSALIFGVSNSSGHTIRYVRTS